MEEEPHINVQILEMCRICEEVDHLIDITTESTSHFQDKLRTISDFKTDENSWLKYICVPCSIELLQAYNFKTKCDQTYLKLIHKHNSNEYSDNSQKEKDNPQIGELVTKVVVKTEDAAEEEPKLHFEIIELAPEASQNKDIAEVAPREEPKLNKEIRKRTKNSVNKSNISSSIPPKRQRVEEQPHCSKSHSDKQFLPLYQHMMTNAKTKFPCNECSKVFLDKKDRYNHIMTTHTGQNKPKSNFSCGKCFLSTKSYKRLQCHLVLHDKNSPTCATCTEVFPSQLELTKHEDTHIQSNQFKCHICNVSFAIQQNLAEHMKFHALNLPHQCMRCSEKFIKKEELIEHRKFCRPVIAFQVVLAKDNEEVMLCPVFEANKLNVQNS